MILIELTRLIGVYLAHFRSRLHSQMFFPLRLSKRQHLGSFHMCTLTLQHLWARKNFWFGYGLNDTLHLFYFFLPKPLAAVGPNLLHLCNINPWHDIELHKHNIIHKHAWGSAFDKLLRQSSHLGTGTADTPIHLSTNPNNLSQWFQWSIIVSLNQLHLFLEGTDLSFGSPVCSEGRIRPTE